MDERNEENPDDPTTDEQNAEKPDNSTKDEQNAEKPDNSTKDEQNAEKPDNSTKDEHNEKKSGNYAAFHEGQGDCNLTDADIAVEAGNEESSKGTRNEAIGFVGKGGGKMKVNIKGGSFTVAAGTKKDDPLTIEWKAKLQEIIGPAPDVINKLLRELKNDLGVIRIEDLKFLDDSDLDDMKSITGVSKKKFAAYVKKMREE